MEIYNRFKQLTGFKYTDIAEEFDLSRQAINQISSNTSKIHKNCMKHMFLTMIDKKIELIQIEFMKLEELRRDIKNM